MAEKGWLTIESLLYMIDCGMLILLTVSEAIISYRKQTDVWLPEPERLNDIIEEVKENIDADENYIIEYAKKLFNWQNREAKDLGRRIICKFTQGGKKLRLQERIFMVNYG